ncbi:13039_t:CDS:1, partial [Gigaspora margarita]
IRDEIRDDEIRSEIRAIVKNFKDDLRYLLTVTQLLYQLWINSL